MKGGALALFNCNYLKGMSKGKSAGNHLTIGPGGKAELGACNFTGPLVVNGKPLKDGQAVPRLTLRVNAHR